MCSLPSTQRNPPEVASVWFSAARSRKPTVGRLKSATGEAATAVWSKSCCRDQLTARRRQQLSETDVSTHFCLAAEGVARSLNIRGADALQPSCLPTRG